VWVGVAVGIEISWQRDGHTAARAREAEIGPDAGSSLASGRFDAAGHATKGREEKGPKFRARASM
jgi:hypothetical protein